LSVSDATHRETPAGHAICLPTLANQDDVAFKVSDDPTGNVRVHFGSDAAESSPPVTLVAGPVVVAPAVAVADAKPLPAVIVEVPQAPIVAAAVVPPPPVVTRWLRRCLPRPSFRRLPLPPSLAQSQVASPYNGEITSFDLKDLDLKDFFRLISSFSGLNIIVDPAVTGTVTMTMTSVPWDQALDIVLKNNQLGKELQGNVLRIAKLSTLQAEEAAVKDLQEAKNLTSDLIQKTYILNYTKADAVAATLTKMLSSRGAIIQEPRRNALIVADLPSQFAKLDRLVQFVDTPAQQVEIEARLLQANKSFSRELGNQLGLCLATRVRTGCREWVRWDRAPFTRSPAPGVTANGSSIPLSVNLPAAGTSGLSFLLGAGADIILDEIITAAEANGTAKLISRPKVVTQNNVPANIQQGTQIPVQTSQNNTVSVQFLQFCTAVERHAADHRCRDDHPASTDRNSAPDFAKAVNGIPSVTTQKAQTGGIMISDGGTAVIGGILVDSDSYNLRQVPGLGSVPLIGHLFKNTQVIKSTSELLFFITARILTRIT